MKQKVITICAAKGGCGKSSSAGAISELAARDGKRTLIIDLDPQCTISLVYDADLTTPGVYEVITGQEAIDDCIQPMKENLYILHSTADVSALKTGPASGKRLSEALESSQRRFDWIVIDTSPALSEGLYNALFASNEVLIPLLSDMASLQAYYQITDIIRQIRGGGKVPKIAGVFLSQYNGRASINKFYQEAIEKQCRADKVKYLGEVRQCIAVREAQAMQKPLFDWAPRCRAAADYTAIYEQLRGGKR